MSAEQVLENICIIRGQREYFLSRALVEDELQRVRTLRAVVAHHPAELIMRQLAHDDVVMVGC